MEITPKWKFVEGSFDTKEVEMICTPDDKHGKVTLSVKEKDSNWNYPIADIKLFSENTYAGFKAVFEDATALGNEIARRWNECEMKM